MKLVTLLVPAYQPRPYVGATPVPYQSGTVDKFKVGLRALLGDKVPLFDGNQVKRLYPDAGGRWVDEQWVTPFSFFAEPDETVTGEAITLALKTFGLKEITAYTQDVQAEVFGADAAAELTAGIHPWNEEA